MDVGKILSSSQLLQRSDNNLLVTPMKETTNAEERKESVVHEAKQKEKPLTADQLKELTTSLNNFLEPAKTSLKFEFHEKLEEYYVTVVNPTTSEVIKEIPSKKMLDIYAAMAEFMGIIVDEKI